MPIKNLKVEALIKPDASYTWFSYTGPELKASNDKGRKLTLEKGEKFGVRKSSNGKSIRLITVKEGPTKVFTCDQDMAQLLAKRCKPTKG